MFISKLRFFTFFMFAVWAIFNLAACSDQSSDYGASARLVKAVGHYNIVKFNGIAYGVPHGVSIDWKNDDLNKIPGMIVESSVQNVEKMISNLSQQTIATMPAETSIVKVVNQYNIVRHNEKIYGIPQGVNINWEKDDLSKVPGVVIETSVKIAEEVIKGLPAPRLASKQPKLLATIGYYNIVEFNGKVYGALHGIDINWQNDALPNKKGMIVGSSPTFMKASVMGRMFSNKLSRFFGKDDTDPAPKSTK